MSDKLRKAMAERQKRAALGRQPAEPKKAEPEPKPEEPGGAQGG